MSVSREPRREILGSRLLPNAYPWREVFSDSVTGSLIASEQTLGTPHMSPAGDEPVDEL